MLNQFIVFLPCMVCLAWFIILLASRDKSKAKRRLMMLALLGIIFFYFQAMFAGFTIAPEDYPAINIIRKTVTLLLFPSGIIYFQTLTGKEPNSPLLSLMMFPSVFLIGALVILYTLMGPDVRESFCEAILAGQKLPSGFSGRIFDLYAIFSSMIYKALIYMYFAISLFLMVRYLLQSTYRIGDLRAFIFKGKESLLVNAIVGCIMILTLSLLICNILEPLFAPGAFISCLIFLIFAVLLFFFFYMGTIFDEMTVYWREIFSPKKTWERKYLEAHPEIAEIKRVLETSRKKSPGGFSVHNRFVLYVEEQEPYLTPDITIDEIARTIAVDKDRLAKVIKESTGLNFRAYMNHKRVEMAKSIMIEFPDLPLNVVAEKSGFTSSSTFSRKFSEIEGMTPSEWMKFEKENTEDQ